MKVHLRRGASPIRFLLPLALVLAACGAPTTSTESPAGVAESSPSAAATTAASASAAASASTAASASAAASTQASASAASSTAASASARASAAASGSAAASARPSAAAGASAVASVDPAAIITVTTTNGPDENDPAALERHEQLLAEFKAVRPDVEIDARSGGFDKEAFAAKFAADTMEDAYLVPFTEPQDLIANGYAADITELMGSWDEFQSFNPELLKIVQDADGKVYGVPVGGYALGLLYNRAMFVEAGLDPDKPPTTWEEVREYATAIKEATGKAGFAEASKGNQGGWHFTAWAYSHGCELETQQGEEWTATFNSPECVQALQTLKDMRWTDQTMTEQQLLEVGDILPLLASGEVAMAIMAGDAMRDVVGKFGGNSEDFGMGPLPQAGGNATLTGGAAWIFNPKSDPEVIQAAFDWTINRDFNLEAYESDLKLQQERGDLVGWPALPLFTGSFQEERDEILNQYANAPVANYTPYLESTLQLRAEPPIETQKMYAELDTAMQAVLTDETADPKTVLDDATARFQSTVLDVLE